MEEKNSIYINKIMREGRRKLNSLTALYNITGKQSRVLVYIFDESQTREVNQTDIEKAFNIRGASVTSILQTLERKKFIKRTESKTDARKKVLRLTPRGEEIYRVINEKTNELEKVMIEGIDEADLATLKKCLDIILKNLIQYTSDCDGGFDED